MYECWTDGSYKLLTNTGGYSAIITKNNQIIKVLYRGYKNTTNNRMELYGVLAVLQWFHNPTEITIYSDSQYIVESIIHNRVNQWIENKDDSKKNMDLWNQIVKLLKYHTVTFKWVKGHNNNEMNEFSDMLAQHAAECLELPEENGTITD